MLQNSVVLLVVLWSLLMVLRRLMPNSLYRFQSALAQGCAQTGWQGLAERLLPAAPAQGCGTGCSSCSTGCSSSASTEVAASSDPQSRPVSWR
jgi:hypothetical protein